MGAPYIDYLIADASVIPDPIATPIANMSWLCRKVSSARANAKSDGAPSRAKAGLPEHCFVFASFNNSYKFDPPMFDIWMRLLIG